MRPGEWVAVFGMGGVGLAALQVAALGAVVLISATRKSWKRLVPKGPWKPLLQSSARSRPCQLPAAVRVSVDAYGGSETAVEHPLAAQGRPSPAARRSGKSDRRIIAIPADAMMLQELQFIGSVGAPTTSYQACCRWFLPAH